MSALYYTLDNMKQPATILVLPVLYQNLPVSAILVQILVNSSIPVSSSICNTRRYWSLPKYEYCRYRKILGNTGYTSIADTGRFWKILVIPVLQILEDSRKYWSYQYCRYWKILENTGNTSIADTGRFWLYQYCRYWKIRYEVAECTCILFFFVLSVRLLWEDGQCIGRPGERRLGARERRRVGVKRGKEETWSEVGEMRKGVGE